MSDIDIILINKKGKTKGLGYSEAMTVYHFLRVGYDNVSKKTTRNHKILKKKIEEIFEDFMEWSLHDFSCPICSMIFSWETELTEHISNYHKEKEN